MIHTSHQFTKSNKKMMWVRKITKVDNEEKYVKDTLFILNRANKLPKEERAIQLRILFDYISVNYQYVLKNEKQRQAIIQKLKEFEKVSFLGKSFNGRYSHKNDKLFVIIKVLRYKLE